jgi:3-oxoacyl-[acyl-carrier protein] reductase
LIDFTGKVFVITGGSRGIGRAAALMAARAGADVGITFHTRAAEAEVVAKEIRSLGRRAFVGGGDLGDPPTVDRIFREVKAAFGGIDGFVANAGVWPSDDVGMKDLPNSRWRSTIAQNLDSVFYSARSALKLLRPNGSMVIVSSTAGQRGEAWHSDYAATKGALIALTKSLAIETAPSIRVNCVAPGWVDTEMSARPYADGGRDRIAAAIPLQRIPSSEDIAAPILFLLSDLARHVTGEVLNVNGGSVLCG